MEKIDELCEELKREVTPENVAKLCKEYESLPEGILKDSVGLSLSLMKMVTEKRVRRYKHDKEKIQEATDGKI